MGFAVAVLGLTADGAIRWTASLGAAVTAPPALAGGVLYVPTGDGKLVALAAGGCGAARCGRLWWGVTGGRVDVQPAVAGGVVFTGSVEGWVKGFAVAGCADAAVGDQAVGDQAVGDQAVGDQAVGDQAVGDGDGQAPLRRPLEARARQRDHGRPCHLRWPPLRRHRGRHTGRLRPVLIRQSRGRACDSTGWYP